MKKQRKPPTPDTPVDPTVPATADHAATEPSMPSKYGKRLSHKEIRLMLALAETGKSAPDIARTMGISHNTVYAHLEDWQDVRDLARKKLEASSLQVAERAITQADPLKLLEGIGVIEGSKSGAPQILIAIGAPSSPLSPPVITIPSETSKK